MGGTHHQVLNSRWLIGLAIIASTAALLSFAARGSRSSLLIPIVFIVVIISCVRRFGFVAGISGSVVATALFALFLFEPYGSFRVSDTHALSNLGVLLFTGIALSYANSRPSDSAEKKQGSSPHLPS